MPLYTWSQTAATNATADSSINWAEGQAPSTVNDSARAMMAATAKYRDDVNGSLTTGGTSTAYTLATNSVYDTLAHLANQTLTFAMNVTSGAAPTLAVDSLAAKPIRLSTGVTLPTGVLVSGSVYSVSYNNGTGEFLLVNPTNQGVAASSLLGNPTGSAAPQSAITLGAGLSFSGTTLVGTLNPALVPGYISGLTLSTAGGSGTFGIAAGVANDSASGGLMSLGSAYTKTTASWAVGTGNGGLDTGAIANSTWYHVFLIKRTDTNVVDVLFSLSATSPTMPTSYTLSRRIGSMKTDASAHWLAFTQTGDLFIWAAQALDMNAVTSTTSRVSTTLTVPTGVVVAALCRVGVLTGTGNLATIFTSLQENDYAPSVSGGVADVSAFFISGGGQFGSSNVERLTNTSAQIGVRSSGVTGAVNLQTYGWKDTRGK